MSGTLVGAPVGHSFIEPGLFPVDPRLHVGVNCASRSCPDLHTEAFTGDRVDEQLDALMRAFLADETKGLACAGSSEMKVSKIIAEWYADDFQGQFCDMSCFLREYGPTDLRCLSDTNVRISAFAYDWALNSARAAGGVVALLIALCK
mmetsp:Transcript_95601/g.219001  ORF Transcript_95601/g.219001 Transcript_95601/m.219001 type:complete len:148 (+) Transcript_95601:2590-3033(+)